MNNSEIFSEEDISKLISEIYTNIKNTRNEINVATSILNPLLISENIKVVNIAGFLLNKYVEANIKNDHQLIEILELLLQKNKQTNDKDENENQEQLSDKEKEEIMEELYKEKRQIMDGLQPITIVEKIR